MMVGVATLATMAGTRHLRLPPLPALLAGVVAAAGTAMLAALLAPRFVLGEHGIRMRDTLRAYWMTRVHPPHIRESA